MALIVKPPSWGHCTTNQPGSPSGNIGVSCTAGANNTDGTVVNGFAAALTHDVEYLIIGAMGYFQSAGNGSAMLDVLIDPAGGTSWNTDPLIPNLLVGEIPVQSGSISVPVWYHFPIWIKSGTALGLRTRTAHTSSLAGRILLMGYGGNANPGSWWCGQHVTPIGVNPSGSQGQNHTPATPGFSSWADLGSPLAAPCGALQFAVQGTNTDVNQTSGFYYFEFGVGSTRIGPQMYRTTGASENGYTLPSGPIFAALPAGAQLRVRGQCNTTPEIIDVAAYAVH